MIDLSSDNPCKNCTKRTATCHGECKDYLTWRNKADSIAAKVRKQSVIEYYGKHDKPVRKKK